MNITEHLLDCVAEECAEVIQNVSKALRFGLEDRNILNPKGPTNRERIVIELNDLLAVITLCVEHNIIRGDWMLSTGAQEDKRRKVLKFMKYAIKTGALQQ